MNANHAWFVQKIDFQKHNDEVKTVWNAFHYTGGFRRIMFWCIAPQALFKAFWRRTWWAASTRRLIRCNLPIWWRSLGQWAMPLAGYPAHLHINLRPGMQGQDIGRQLINQFLAQLRVAGIPGVHLITREDNMAALAFFEKMGFARLDRRPFMRIGPGVDNIRYSVIMVKPLAQEPEFRRQNSE